MNKEQLQEILGKHKKWLLGEIEGVRAVLTDAVLTDAVLRRADLSDAVLRRADLSDAVLTGAVLRWADLTGAVLTGAVLTGAVLTEAVLTGVVLTGAKGLVKLMGVELGNIYWKRFNAGLNNNGCQFFVGLNTLPDGEEFAADDRELYSYPGFHFASRSWCSVNYPDRPLEARIRIPMNAQVNEPWATDGKASADKIEILQVFDTTTGEDVTDQYRRDTP